MILTSVEIIFFVFSLDLPIAVRLVGGTTPNKGRVEVYRYGYWGSICRDGWNLPDASVVCRMLGYSGAWSATCCSEYQGGTGPVWLSGLNCNGREESLSECSHRGWGVTNCDHTKDAEIICHSPPTDKPLPHYSKETMAVVVTSTSSLSSAVTAAVLKPSYSSLASSTLQLSTSVILNPTTSNVQSTLLSNSFEVAVPSAVSPSFSFMVASSSVDHITSTTSNPTTTNVLLPSPSSPSLFVLPSLISPSSSYVVSSSSVASTTPAGKFTQRR